MSQEGKKRSVSIAIWYDDHALTVSNLARGPLGKQVEIIVYRDGVRKVTIHASRTGALSETSQNVNNILNQIM